MFELLKQLNASVLGWVRRLNHHRLPGIFNRYPNRTAKILPSVVISELAPGIPMRFELRDSIQRELYLNGSLYERADIDLLSSLCAGSGTAFLDIGANVGVYSFWSLSRFPSVRVFAFEPNPRTFGKLSETKSLGNYPTLHLIQSALGDASGTATMCATDLNSGASTLGSNPDLPGLRKYEVPVITFDEWREQNTLLFAGIEQYVIKLDVEGFEPRVIRGMFKFLTRENVSLILVEFLDLCLRNAGHTAAELYDLLLSAGYTGYTDREFKSPLSGPPPAPAPVNVYFRRNALPDGDLPITHTVARSAAAGESQRPGLAFETSPRHGPAPEPIGPSKSKNFVKHLLIPSAVHRFLPNR